MCHNLGVMHIENNACETIISTLLNIPEIIKDGINTWLDMVDMGIQEELTPQKRGNKL